MEDPKNQQDLDLSHPQRQKAMKNIIRGQCIGLISVQAIWSGGLGILIVLSFGGSKFSAMLVQSSLYVGHLISVWVNLQPLPQDRLAFMLRNLSYGAVLMALAGFIIWWAPVGWVVPLFISAMFLCRLSVNRGTAYWFPILQDTVPQESRGRFLSILRGSWHVTGLIVVLLISYFLDQVVTDESTLSDKRFIYGGLMLLFSIIFWFRNLFFKKLPRIDRKFLEKDTQGSWQELIRIFTEQKRFTLFLLYMLLLRFFSGVLHPHLIATMKEMGFSDGKTLQISILGSVGSVAAFLVCTTLVDRIGPRKVFAMSHLIMGCSAVALAFVSYFPISQWISLLGLHMLIQAVQASVGVAVTTYLFHILGGTYRSLSFSVFMALNSVVMFLSNIILGAVLDHGTHFFSVSALELSSGIFAVTGVFILLSLPGIRAVDEGSWKAGPDTKFEGG